MKRITLILLNMILVPLAMMAQSVTVSPETGNLVAAISDNSQETGFQNGLSALWRHEQLAMSLTTSDYSTLTTGGEFSTPCSNMCVNQTTGLLTVLGGQSNDCYLVLSLPKGYRFKKYKIIVQNNLNGQTVKPTANNTFALGSTTKTLVEQKGNFDGEILVSTEEMGTTNETMTNDQGETVPKEYTLERRSDTPTDMGNQLYFRIQHGSTAYYGLTIKSFTVEFTAEGTFEAQVASLTRDVAKSMVMVPFKTNKMDIGAVQSSEKNGSTFYAYTYNKVHDIDAYNYIYQDNAIQDGIPMDVATNKKISPVRVDGKEYFAFENGIYYVEAPTQVYSQTGLTYPIGFRIVGAKFTPQWGSTTASITDSRTEYYITYTSGSTTYYLNDQLRFTTTKFGWMFDEETKNFYIGTYGNYRYLSCEGSGDTRTLTLSSLNGSWYNLIAFTRNSTNYVGWDNSTSSQRYYLKGNTNNTLPTVVRNSTTTTARWSSGQGSFTVPGYTPGSYTLKVYDKNGTSAVETVSVNSAADAGTAIDLTAKTYGYNNDAIKFEISGLTNGNKALVDVSVFMQALNPYIDQMNIICHDSDNQLSLSQPFKAENFKVSGGKFKFYIPSEYNEEDLTFTFSDLWSQYGDNTYYTDDETLHRDGYARYSFVTSSYFEPIDQNGDDGLYDDAYNPDASYVNKVKTSTAGNIRYKFNNAENLSNTATNPPAVSYLEEYPFTAANYIGSDDPDGSTEKGDFIACEMNAQDTESSTYYLFVADETRYNIAPSTAWQHRYYAFYRMEIDLQTSNYDPQLVWTKVYDKSCYNKNGAVATDAMYGLKLKTVDHDTQAPMEGYLTVKQIHDAITAVLNKTDAPKTMDQILYVDGSDLYSILSSKITSGETTTEMTLENLRNELADNVLIYLPANTTSTLPNCAYKPNDWKVGDAYQAGSNIVLTDNRPFYAPFDINVDVDNIILHERKVTVDKNGKVTSASIIMPFGILIDENGTHTNLDGGSFKLHQMQGNNCLTTGEGEDFVYFPVLKDVKKSDPNTPYLVEVTKAPEGEGSDQLSFVLSQNGGLIKATGTGNANWDYTYAGESGSGKKDNTTYTFTNHGSYSGKLLNKADNYFYFAKNMFLRSNDYAYDDGIKVAPFRSYYSTTSTTTRSASPLKEFDVIPAALGDVNTDGNVTSADADSILNIILGKEEPKRLTTIMADVNTDGSVTVADVTALVNMILGKQTQVEE